MGDLLRTITRYPAVRVVALALLLLLGGSAASAFTISPGFTATVYASAPSSLAGLAFVGTTLYAASPSDGGLYRGVAGAAPIALERLASLGGAPTGVAALGGDLYVTQAGGGVARLDPATGARIGGPIATSAEIPCVNAIAAHPALAELFVTTCDAIWRIASPAGSPTITRYAELFPGGTATYGIAISGDDRIFVAAPSLGQVWQVPGPTNTTAVKGPVAYVAGARGVTLVGSHLFVSAGDGSITKAALPEAGGATIPALLGGGSGDLATRGPDGCVYASQGAAVVRLADALGGCDLAAASPPPPLPSLRLERTSTNEPLVGGGDQTFTATLSDVATPGGVSVTFTVGGANSVTRTETTAPNGIATFAYVATAVGEDRIFATAVVNGATIRSNELSLSWPRAYDRALPTISYTVTGTTGANFGCPRADIGTPGVTEYCGWFTTPPTLTWTVTANGPSGIGALTSCPPYTLAGSSPIAGTPVTCIAYNGDGESTALQVRLQATATPPDITASARTSDGAPYLAGTPTELAVTVSFTCDSALGADGVVGCTAPVTVGALGTTTVTGIVSDVAGTTRTATFDVLIVDRTGPVTSATIAPVPDAGGAVPLAATVTITATDPSGVASVTYWTTGAQTTAPRTVSGGLATVVIGAIGETTVWYYATDRAGNTGPLGSTVVRVIATQPSSLRIVSSPFQETGAVTLRASLVGADGVSPVAGRTVTFSGAGISVSAVTGATGVATATVTLAPGQYTVRADFIGDGAYEASAASQVVTVYEMTRFAVWAPNAAIGAAVQFYGADWSKQIADKAARKGFAEFKGYAERVFDAYWAGRTGDALKPPATIPQYIGVILTTGATKTGDTIHGDVAGVAIVRVDPQGKRTYDGRLGKRGYGVVLGLAAAR